MTDTQTSQTGEGSAAQDGSGPSEAPAYDAKAVLHRYVKSASGALVWKLEGLDEYDVRRPLTATGLNLLGVVKHVAGVSAEYFGAVFDRPFPEPLPWYAEGAEENADFWATPDESREYITGLYHRAWEHADATIEALDLDATGHVSWWPAERNPVTLHQILVHMLAELNRHAGHADILREQLDHKAGLNQRNSNLPDHDEAWWTEYLERVEAAAKEASGQGE
ncbi:DinB family protein [Actinospica durhamensis]|uniref:DinB family protein n=1 Tax=Actinospica durhamensis TaxID=1508375 RepID=A0A941EPE2_9ACTN|nr:DinB family protein [Actinospica durhamensis]MBR7834741.1 DinB family protein [Actinospica durhamensis]